MPARLPDRFLIEHPLGRGASGSVWQVVDRVTGERVALKQLDPGNEHQLRHLKAEFAALRRVDHPGVVKVRELDAEADPPWFTMEVVEGVSFAAWASAPDQREEPARVRAVLADVADGLAHLHAAALLHRDVKADNLRVTRDGRGVILDLGAVARADAALSRDDRGMAGSPDEMAPEVAWEGVASPAADVYSAAVVIWWALAGTTPFAGPPDGVLVEKARRAPCAAAGLPADLAPVLIAALDPDPVRRPTAAALARALRGAPTQPRARGGDAWVGRERELRELSLALRGAAPALVVVSGEPGLGKTSLVERALVAAVTERPRPVLVSRCHPVMTVALPSLDGLVDELGAVLDGAPSFDVPPGAAAALALFPSLRRLPGLVRRGSVEALPPSHDERRRLALDVVRALLMAVAGGGAVVWVDDLQWAESEGVHFLGSLLRDRLPITLVVTHRAREGEEQLRTLTSAAAAAGAATARLPLAALEPAESAALAASLAAGALDAAAAARVAAHAAGSPLLVRQLCRAGGASNLDQAVAVHLAALTEPERAVLFAVALAHAPLDPGTVAAVTGLERPLVVARRLVDASLVQPFRGREARLELVHELLRRAVVRQLPAPARAALHRRIALALEGATEASPLALARHWHEAGEPALAHQHAHAAGVAAVERGAFELGMALLDLAQDTAADDLERLTLLEALGGAAGTLGHTDRAARAFDTAWALAQRLGVGEERTVALEGQAAAWLLRAARLDEGRTRLERHLRRHGGVERAGRWRYLASSLFAQARSAEHHRTLRELARRGAVGEGDPASRARLEALWHGVAGLTYADPLEAARLTAVHAELAAASGERMAVLRALGGRGTALAISPQVGNPADAWAAIELGLRLAAASGRVEERTMAEVVAAACCFYLGRWREVQEHALRAARLMTELTVPIELHANDARCLRLLGAWLGAPLDQLDLIRHDALSEARRGADGLSLASAASGLSVLAPLARGQGDAAEAELDAALAPYASAPAANVHAWGALARALIALHRGQGERARRVAWAELVPGPRMPMNWLARNHRALLLYLGALGAVSEARAGRGRPSWRVRAAVRALRAERAPWCDALAALVESGLAVSQGARLAALRGAERAAAEAGMPLIEGATRHRLAQLTGSAPPAWPPWVVDVERFVSVLVPGVPG